MSLQKEYLEFRLNSEEEFLKFKEEQKSKKQRFLQDLKNLNGVSPTRVHIAITENKKIEGLSLEELVNKTFENIISSMERSFKNHYVNNESEIKKYITEIYTLQKEMKEFRNLRKTKFNDLKNKMKNNNVNMSILNITFFNMRNSLFYMKKHKITLDEYKNQTKEAEEIANSILVERCKQETFEKIQEVKEKPIKKAKKKMSRKELEKITLEALFGMEFDWKSI